MDRSLLWKGVSRGKESLVERSLSWKGVSRGEESLTLVERSLSWRSLQEKAENAAKWECEPKDRILGHCFAILHLRKSRIGCQMPPHGPHISPSCSRTPWSDARVRCSLPPFQAARFLDCFTFKQPLRTWLGLESCFSEGLG